MKDAEIGCIDFVLDRASVGDTSIVLGQLNGLASGIVGAVEVIIAIRPERETVIPQGAA